MKSKQIVTVAILALLAPEAQSIRLNTFNEKYTEILVQHNNYHQPQAAAAAAKTTPSANNGNTSHQAAAHASVPKAAPVKTDKASPEAQPKQQKEDSHLHQQNNSTKHPAQQASQKQALLQKPASKESIHEQLAEEMDNEENEAGERAISSKKAEVTEDEDASVEGMLWEEKAKGQVSLLDAYTSFIDKKTQGEPAKKKEQDSFKKNPGKPSAHDDKHSQVQKSSPSSPAAAGEDQKPSSLSEAAPEEKLGDGAEEKKKQALMRKLIEQVQNDHESDSQIQEFATRVKTDQEREDIALKGIHRSKASPAANTTTTTLTEPTQKNKTKSSLSEPTPKNQTSFAAAAPSGETKGNASQFAQPKNATTSSLSKAPSKVEASPEPENEAVTAAEVVPTIAPEDAKQAEAFFSSRPSIEKQEEQPVKNDKNSIMERASQMINEEEQAKSVVLEALADAELA